MSFSQEKFKQAIVKNQFEWRQHAIQRLAERGILQDDVLQILKKGETIETYDGTSPYPSALYFGMIDDRPLHVVAAFDESNGWVYIITVYIPDEDHFEEDYKTRRKL